MFETLRLTEQLLARESITPDDSGCQALLGERLEACGFELETMIDGPAVAPVSNLWAIRHGSAAGDAARTMVFAGHTDVVPTGPVEKWVSPPFVPAHRDGKLFARGACDMKASLAAFVVAIETFLAEHPDPRLTLAVLLTSDEEGPALHGTATVCRVLAERGTRMDFCVVGEPSSVERCGDVIKYGRRGTMNGRLRIKGVQGHIAYPQLARNPIHKAARALAELVDIDDAGGWDDAPNEHFQPTSWQMSNYQSGTGAFNVIPGDAVLDFNFRYSTSVTAEQLQQRVASVLDAHGLDYRLEWVVVGRPFLTRPGVLERIMRQAVHDETGLAPQLSTSGGTSDARFIATICEQVLELGPVNATIHKVNEHVKVDDLEILKNIYARILRGLEQHVTR